MGFLQKLSRLLFPAVKEEPNITWIYVQCNRCGEKLRARVNSRTELTPEFNNSDIATSFHCRKVLMGDKQCFQQIEIILKFDSKYHMVDKQISGGKFISPEEYELL